MPGLVPGMHVFVQQAKAWMAGTSPAMTSKSVLVKAHAMMSGVSWSSIKVMRSRR
jgi:hypothetical protein